MKKIKLQKLLKALSPEVSDIDFSEFDSAMSKVKSSLKKTVQAKTLEDVNRKLEKFRQDIDIAPLQSAVTNIQKQYEDNIGLLRQELDGVFGKLEETLSAELADGQRATLANRQEAMNNVQSLQFAIQELTDEKNQQIEKLNGVIAKLQEYSSQFADNLSSLQKDYISLTSSKADLLELDKREKAVLEILTEYKREWNARFSSLQTGGGHANRDITIGGNSSTLSKYTDINFKAGTGVTLTYTNNDTTKKLDVTITATGSGSGITREISTVSASSVIGAVAGTDKVIIASQGIQLTLPTAVGDTNLYTIKNTSSSSVLVATTGGQTIDGDANIILATQYTAVDLISDSTNWHIT